MISVPVSFKINLNGLLGVFPQPPARGLRVKAGFCGGGRLLFIFLARGSGSWLVRSLAWSLGPSSGDQGLCGVGDVPSFSRFLNGLVRRVLQVPSQSGTGRLGFSCCSSLAWAWGGVRRLYLTLSGGEWP